MQGVKINQVEFNIGLKNNPYDEHEIMKVLRRSEFTTYETTHYSLVMSEWKGYDEETFTVALGTTMSVEDIIDEVEGLCKIFHQNAIAILINNVDGYLVYHPHYEKKKLDFDRDLFIDAYNKNYVKNYK